LEFFLKDAFAMICQLGPPTFFVTYTNAKIRWIALMSSLRMLNKKYIDIPKNFDKLEFKHMGDLVQYDLVTCTHYYDHHMAIFRNLLKNDSSIFGKVNDFYFVIEFQNKGSEHDHGVLWIKDAPNYGVNNNETIGQFVNKYVTLNNSLVPSH
jgi:hypothetical protein